MRKAFIVRLLACGIRVNPRKWIGVGRLGAPNLRKFNINHTLFGQEANQQVIGGSRLTVKQEEERECEKQMLAQQDR
jgi:DeoR/GlpR family transcriptional regulator of sugar metabolism